MLVPVCSAPLGRHMYWPAIFRPDESVKMYTFHSQASSPKGPTPDQNLHSSYIETLIMGSVKAAVTVATYRLLAKGVDSIEII